MTVTSREDGRADIPDLATFRMVILADELLEGFFNSDLPASFQLGPRQEEDYHQTQQKSEGLLGGFMSLVVTNEYAQLLEL